MSKRIELSLNTGYVQHWGFWEAMRELFQNAIDTQDYDIDLGYSTVEIISRGGKIPVKSLLLGATSKADDSESIGKFGEGLKLALLVLTREGYDVSFNNYGDEWTANMEYSDTYETECLTVYIEEGNLKNQDCVSILVRNVSKEDINILHEKYREPEEATAIVSSRGKALYPEEYYQYEDDQEYRNNVERDFCNVFVNGLFVSQVNGNYYFDYNFKPSSIKLDRDRGTVDNFELQWEATQLIVSSGDVSLMNYLSSSSFDDIKYYGETHGYMSQENKKDLEYLAVKSFHKEYGEKAFPIKRSWSSDKKRLITYKIASLGLVAIEVHDSFYNMFNEHFKLPEAVTELLQFNPVSFFSSFLSKHGRNMRAKPRKVLENKLKELSILMGK